MMIQCNICLEQREQGVEAEGFSVPYDHVGIALMQAHFNDKHPEITLPAGRD